LDDVTGSATSNITATLRDLGCAIGAAARSVSRSRIVWTVVGITALLVAAWWLPLPSPVQMRDWAQSVGPWFPRWRSWPPTSS
jgi:hypothetical protein